MVANTTWDPGRRGGIHKPNGDIVKQVDRSTPSVLHAVIPLS